MVDIKINVKGTEIIIFRQRDDDYVSLTDIARYKNSMESGLVIANWLRSRNTIELLGIWEQIYNPNFNLIEFDKVKNQSGANRFILSSKQWIKRTNAIGLISKTGRYKGGTFAHKDIAFEFATWVSPEFKFYLIKEFQRLKEDENQRKSLEWNVKRLLAKVNYKVHTDAVKENLIPLEVSKSQRDRIYSSEGDVLNVAMFGTTALEWRENNPGKKGNIRDYANVTQLVCLAGLESLNAEFIRQNLRQGDRLKRLNEIAIIQMKSLTGHKQFPAL